MFNELSSDYVTHEPKSVAAFTGLNVPNTTRLPYAIASEVSLVFRLASGV